MSSNRTLTMILGILIVVALVLGVIVAYLFFTQDSAPPPRAGGGRHANNGSHANYRTDPTAHRCSAHARIRDR